MNKNTEITEPTIIDVAVEPVEKEVLPPVINKDALKARLAKAKKPLVIAGAALAAGVAFALGKASAPAPLEDEENSDSTDDLEIVDAD